MYSAKADLENGCFTTPNKKINKGTPHESGYSLITLETNGAFKTDYLHRCIWKAANNCDIPCGFVVHHIDGNKSNSSISNLSLCSKSRIHPKKKIVSRNSNCKCAITAKTGDVEKHYTSMRACAKDLDISLSLISKIVNNKQYHHTSKSKKDNLRYTFCRQNKCRS